MSLFYECGGKCLFDLVFGSIVVGLGVFVVIVVVLVVCYEFGLFVLFWQ